MTNPFGIPERRQIIGSYLTKVPFTYSSAIIIGRPSVENKPICANGTATLIETPYGRYAVTNDHVLSQYEKFLAEDSSTAFQLGRDPIAPLERIVDRNVAADLCLLNAEGIVFERERHGEPSEDEQILPDLEFYSMWTNNEPPKIAQEGDVCLFGGYPGKMRRQDGQVVTFPTYSVAGTLITGSFPKQFSVTFDRTEWELANKGEKEDLVFKAFGGMSGGPVLIDGPGFLRPALVGIIKEHNSDYDQLIAAHIGLINPHGKISTGGLF